ncbi:MAG: hypothetical protein V3V00_07605 [Saprospiraceae bacterium]
MNNRASFLQRMIWLLAIEIKVKQNLYLLTLLVTFAILSFSFFNTTIVNIFDFLLNSRSVILNRSGNITSLSNIRMPMKFHLDYFPLALFITGSIVTSLSFKEYTEESSRRFHISLPATLIEKWLVKVIWCLFIFPFLFLVLYHLFALVTYQWGQGMGREYVRISFLDPYIWRYMLYHFGFQSLVLGVASYFRNSAVIKGVLAGLGAYFFLIATRNVLVFAFFPDFELEKMEGFFSKEGYISYLKGAHFSAGEITKDLTYLFNDYTFSIYMAIGFIGVLYVSFRRFEEFEA